MDWRLSETDARHTQRAAQAADVVPFSYAFQPIVDTAAQEIFSYEALIRGPVNEPAFWVLERASDKPGRAAERPDTS